MLLLSALLVCTILMIIGLVTALQHAHNVSVSVRKVHYDQSIDAEARKELSDYDDIRSRVYAHFTAWVAGIIPAHGILLLDLMYYWYSFTHDITISETHAALSALAMSGLIMFMWIRNAKPNWLTSFNSCITIVSYNRMITNSTDLLEEMQEFESDDENEQQEIDNQAIRLIGTIMDLQRDVAYHRHWLKDYSQESKR